MDLAVDSVVSRVSGDLRLMGSFRAADLMFLIEMVMGGGFGFVGGEAMVGLLVGSQGLSIALFLGWICVCL
ncbi:hypothetical protein Syun_022537 [Stephania yunnanensis]|uniref:Uncharacterized protein n=1 Tax=Stephania yunnanensis TaxID=152371 RepID=A0AAP0F852_9MAGN